MSKSQTRTELTITEHVPTHSGLLDRKGKGSRLSQREGTMELKIRRCFSGGL